MTKKRVNEAWQAYDNLPDKERKEVARKLNAYGWYCKFRLHALKNPFEKY